MLSCTRTWGKKLPLKKKMNNHGFICVKARHKKWIPVKTITKVIQFQTLDEYKDYKDQRNLSAHFNLESHIACKCKTSCVLDQSMTCMKSNFPIYLVFVSELAYLVEFSEYEKLERILEGTDNPMYDFVHELRYNPNSFMKGRELQEAENDFDINKKRKNGVLG